MRLDLIHQKVGRIVRVDIDAFETVLTIVQDVASNESKVVRRLELCAKLNRVALLDFVVRLEVHFATIVGGLLLVERLWL